jgi:hypothetical protein
LIKISKIKSNPNNPRIIKDDKFQKLVKSIQEFPEMLNIRPVVVNKDLMVLGGNMRLKAAIEAGLKEVPIIETDLSEEKQKEFIIKDNVSGGEWNWDVLANDWDQEQLSDWGLDIPHFETDDNYGTDFSLKDGDKEPFQQMTFTLADGQATVIKNAIDDIKGTEEYKFTETMGNENSNGNALYLIVASWAGQRK